MYIVIILSLHYMAHIPPPPRQARALHSRDSICQCLTTQNDSAEGRKSSSRSRKRRGGNESVHALMVRARDPDRTMSPAGAILLVQVDVGFGNGLGLETLHGDMRVSLKGPAIRETRR